MEHYLQDMANLITLRIKERVMTSLRDIVNEQVSGLIDKSRDTIVRTIKDRGVSDEAVIEQTINTIMLSTADAFIKTRGAEIVGRVPDIIVAETGKVATEMAEVVKSASAQATREIIKELTGKEVGG